MNPGQESNRSRGTKIKRSLPHSVDRFFQQLADVINAFQGSAWEARVVLPASILLTS
jgi:hypothetical protein